MFKIKLSIFDILSCALIFIGTLEISVFESTTLTLYFYGIIFLMTIYSFLRFGSIIDDRYSWWSLGVLLIWFYGAGIGILMGYDLDYVLRNFFGMNIFILIMADPLRRFHYKQILNSLILIGIFAVIMNILLVLNQVIFYTGYFDFDIRYIYNSTLVLADMIFMYGFVNLIHKIVSIEDSSLGLISSLLFMFVGFFVCFVAHSKSIFLVMILNILLIIYFELKRMISKKFILTSSLKLLISCIVYFIIIFTIVFILISIVGKSDIRFSQATNLIMTSNIFGNGLGFIMPRYASYGYELTYLALFNKFGILSVFLFLYYFFLIKKIIKLFLIDIYAFYICLTLLVGILVMSAFNPMLYSPVFVVCQVYIISVLRKLNL